MDQKRAWTVILAGIILAALIVPFALWGRQFPVLFRDPEPLRLLLSRYRPYSPLVLIALQVAQILLAPLPGQILGLTSGYFFGPLWGTLYSTIGNTLGSLLAFLLARILGRPLVERLVNPDILSRIDEGARERGLAFFFLVFLLPFLPDDVACYAAGLTSLPLPSLVLASLVGRLPGLAVSNLIGAGMGGFSTAQWAVIGVGSAVGAILFWQYQQRIEEAMFRLLSRRGRGSNCAQGDF
ncbi:MAG: TVP38/TMEM64 family protein [Chloroflexi bacterium]|nr:TVP38/TMEM64 family protein [Chloroflexota bacterium]